MPMEEKDASGGHGAAAADKQGTRILSFLQFAAICELESAVVNFLVSWGNRTDHKGSVGRSHARIRAEDDQLAVVVSGISGR